MADGGAGRRDNFEFSQQPRRARPQQSHRPSEYRSFEGTTKAVRDGLIRSLAESVIGHTEANGGRCRHGFMKELLASVGSSVAALEITRDSINNEVRRIRAARKKASEQAAAQVSAAESSSPSDCSQTGGQAQEGPP